VVARQEDVTIYSDKLVIYYGDKQDQVDKIEAIGSVRILQTNRIGTGGHALYESREGKITLSGNPKVTQDKDSITGKVIVYYLDDDRSVVIGGENARVEAVIHPTKSGAPEKHDAKNSHSRNLCAEGLCKPMPRQVVRGVNLSLDSGRVIGLSDPTAPVKPPHST